LKALFDFLPVVAFFVAYMAFGRDIYLATKVTMVATLLQMVFLRVRRLPITFTNIAVAVMVWGLGGLTLALHNPLFIKWKPTVVYWIFAAFFIGSQYIGDKPLLERALGHAAELDRASWRRFSWAWAVFFLLLGALNVYVLYNFSEEFWVKFKLFGCLGLVFAFSLAQGVWIAMKSAPEKPAESTDNSGAQ